MKDKNYLSREPTLLHSQWETCPCPDCVEIRLASSRKRPSFLPPQKRDDCVSRETQSVRTWISSSGYWEDDILAADYDDTTDVVTLHVKGYVFQLTKEDASSLSAVLASVLKDDTK